MAMALRPRFQVVYGVANRLLAIFFHYRIGKFLVEIVPAMDASDLGPWLSLLATVLVLG